MTVAGRRGRVLGCIRVLPACLPAVLCIASLKRKKLESIGEQANTLHKALNIPLPHQTLQMLPCVFCPPIQTHDPTLRQWHSLNALPCASGGFAKQWGWRSQCPDLSFLHLHNRTLQSLPAEPGSSTSHLSRRDGQPRGQQGTFTLAQLLVKQAAGKTAGALALTQPLRNAQALLPPAEGCACTNPNPLSSCQKPTPRFCSQ